MTLDEVMQTLETKGTESTKRTHLRHGAVEPLFGVKIGDLKPLQKQLKGQQALALELYATKNSDAMYLAGLVADGAQMTRKQLDQWASSATWHMIAGCTVPWVTADHPQAFEIGLKWIDSKKDLVAIAGWATLAAVVSKQPDDELPLDEVRQLLDRCASKLHQAANRVRYVMNSFVICVGTYVEPLGKQAIEVARALGKVDVDMGDTACQIPDAESYIIKCRRGAKVAPKRKSVRC